MTDLLDELRWRGLLHQVTDEAGLKAYLAAGVGTIYAGFDPTADSLHVGNLMALMFLRRFQRAGHRPLVLVGGATGMIGDPSGKSAERNLLSEEELARNVAAIEAQVGRFLDYAPAGGHAGPATGPGAVLVNNHDWMKGYDYLAFLRDVGKHVPVNVMLAKDSVQSRLTGDNGLSYTEFSYMLLQANDFVVLHDRYACRVQLGGSDQWGNITAGIDLGRRLRGAQLFGMTCPLLTDSSGNKVGKTSGGQRVWLSAEKMSPYLFYQYWVRAEDADVEKYLKFLTELSREEIEALATSRAERPHERQSQVRLAEELTRIVHGEEGLAAARRATDVFFGGDVRQLSDGELLEVFADVPSAELPRARVGGAGLPLAEALVAAGLAKSNGEARRLVVQGGVYVNNGRVDAADLALTGDHLVGGRVVVLRSGKKRYAILKFA